MRSQEVVISARSMDQELGLGAGFVNKALLAHSHARAPAPCLWQLSQCGAELGRRHGDWPMQPEPFTMVGLLGEIHEA